MDGSAAARVDRWSENRFFHDLQKFGLNRFFAVVGSDVLVGAPTPRRFGRGRRSCATTSAPSSSFSDLRQDTKKIFYRFCFIGAVNIPQYAKRN